MFSMAVVAIYLRLESITLLQIFFGSEKYNNKNNWINLEEGNVKSKMSQQSKI